MTIIEALKIDQMAMPANTCHHDRKGADLEAVNWLRSLAEQNPRIERCRRWMDSTQAGKKYAGSRSASICDLQRPEQSCLSVPLAMIYRENRQNREAGPSKSPEQLGRIQREGSRNARRWPA
jgi:hypothetical protein